MWDWVKNKLSAEEISNEILLTTDNRHMTSWHVAAEKGELEILQKICDLAEEKLRIR